jgi:hypothetical protein
VNCRAPIDLRMLGLRRDAAVRMRRWFIR